MSKDEIEKAFNEVISGVNCSFKPSTHEQGAVIEWFLKYIIDYRRELYILKYPMNEIKLKITNEECIKIFYDIIELTQYFYENVRSSDIDYNNKPIQIAILDKVKDIIHTSFNGLIEIKSYSKFNKDMPVIITIFILTIHLKRCYNINKMPYNARDSIIQGINVVLDSTRYGNKYRKNTINMNFYHYLNKCISAPPSPKRRKTSNNNIFY